MAERGCNELLHSILCAPLSGSWPDAQFTTVTAHVTMLLLSASQKLPAETDDGAQRAPVLAALEDTIMYAGDDYPLLGRVAWSCIACV